MSNFVLKIVAISIMLIDHIGAILVSPSQNPQVYIILRSIGRLAFPIFVFLIVEGFHHTSNLKKYLIRLGIFALISEIPFDLAFYRVNFGSDIFTDLKNKSLAGVLGNLFDHQNIFVTLFLGLLLIYLMSMVEKKFAKNIFVSNTLEGVFTIAFCLAALILRADYGISGILMIVAFYLFRGSKIIITFALFIVNGTLIGNISTGNIFYAIQIFAVLSIIPILLYNEKKGKNIKYFFYIFYPAHLLLLFFISRFIL